MCLEFKLLSQWGQFEGSNPNQRITAWKVLNCCHIPFRLTSPTYRQVWTPGWVWSNRPSTQLGPNEIRTNTVAHGIHVYLLEEEARQYETHTQAIVKVRCVLRDLVAVGHVKLLYQDGPRSAVFTKVWLSQKEFNRHV